MKHKQNWFGYVIVIIVLELLAVIAVVGIFIYDRSNETAQQKSNKPDSVDTLLSPQKVASADGKAYFVYGAPAGQNNESPKRIIISLPGHSTTAETGYEAWQPHLAGLNGGNYALAEFNWWDGGGNKVENYYNPTNGMKQIRAFLQSQGYTSSDIVVLHGFSRGSANTYGFVANDQKMGNPVFNAVISNSGKYESDFSVFSGGFKDSSQPSDADYTKYFSGMPWVLVCGGKDPNVGQSDCASMEQTKSFLQQHKANVLGLLKDPNEGHGAFHMSQLELPTQAIDLIEKALNQ
jgi:hypothetical protein